LFNFILNFLLGFFFLSVILFQFNIQNDNYRSVLCVNLEAAI
jgi:hypothetical protein